jgi:hypothetical protein
VRALATLLAIAVPALASTAAADDMSNMPGMNQPAEQKSETSTSKSSNEMQNMPGMSEPSGQKSETSTTRPGKEMKGMPGMETMAMSGLFGTYPMSRDASGTSWQPDAAEHHGIHIMADDWTLMAHLMLTGIYDWQSGPRGDTMGFLSGMAMLMARRDLPNGDGIGLRAMLSPDPFMGRAGYPLLLQTGETADGTTPLLDRQHPHDLFMELAASYDHRFGSTNSLFFYFGYPGEPALGPAAFMHRASAMDNPLAPLSHHWLDSTHITFGVATAGFVHENWKFEISQFTGREPDQHRFDLDRARFDSTAARVTFNPDEHWSLQASWGFLRSPEQLDPLVNETRLTASATYVMPLGEESSFAGTLAFGRKQLTGGTRENAWLAEAEYKPGNLWTLFARAESVETDELAAGPIRTVGEATLGAIRDFRVAKHLKAGVGGSYTVDITPSALTPTYGDNPRGATLFVRIVGD